MNKIYTIFGLSIDVTTIRSISNIIKTKNNEYFININNQEYQIFSISQHEKGNDFIRIDNELFRLYHERDKDKYDIELINTNNEKLAEIGKEIYAVVKLEVEKLINYWMEYNNGVD